MESWDEFVLLANKILDDDLFVVVSARTASVSHDPDMASLPEFLSKYFVDNNMIVIYPEQFGAEAVMPVMGDAISADVESMPSGLLMRLSQYARSAHKVYRRIFKPNKPDAEL